MLISDKNKSKDILTTWSENNKMANRTELLTDWLTIATAGPTWDGRTIDEYKLIEAAASYDPSNFTAVINAEHLFGNFGLVRELRTGKDDKGRTILQARIAPNQYAINQNKTDYRLFFSVELCPNFAGSGKYYLTGLAMTDKPASLGTSELHFTARKDAGAECYSMNEATAFKAADPASDQNGPVTALINGLINFFTNKTNEGKDEMTKEEKDEMMGLLKANSETLIKLTASLTAQKEEQTGAETGKTAEQKKTEDNSATVTPEMFKELVSSQTQMIKAVEKLSAQVTAGMKEQEGTATGENSGAVEEPKFI